MRKEQLTFNGFAVPDSYFYDSRHFPHGFSRSGEFTIKQANILNVLGRHLAKLNSGEMAAKTPEELQFVKVCLGEADAQSDVERTWQRYQLAIHKAPSICSTVSKTIAQSLIN